MRIESEREFANETGPWIGAEDGVWMGFGGEMKTFKQVLTVNNVTQMAVLEDFGIFIARWPVLIVRTIPD